MSFADKFNLLNEFNILRLICGLFLIPHIYGKFYEPAALGFFMLVMSFVMLFAINLVQQWGQRRMGIGGQR